jgi:hypothetical protein
MTVPAVYCGGASEAADMEGASGRPEERRPFHTYILTTTPAAAMRRLAAMSYRRDLDHG